MICRDDLILGMQLHIILVLLVPGIITVSVFISTCLLLEVLCFIHAPINECHTFPACFLS